MDGADEFRKLLKWNNRRALVRSSKWALGKSAILHSCIMGQESRECTHNAQLCKHSFGKGFCSGLFSNSFLPLKSNIKHQKSVADQKERKPKRGKGATPRQRMFC